jgi:hypothetical protein
LNTAKVGPSSNHFGRRHLKSHAGLAIELDPNPPRSDRKIWERKIEAEGVQGGGGGAAWQSPSIPGCSNTQR